MRFSWERTFTLALKGFAYVMRRRGGAGRLRRCPICGAKWDIDTEELQVCTEGHEFDFTGPSTDTGPEPDPNAPHSEI